ncbi:MAG TPA: carboxylating nicotinate-nucleotide diphosphorylase [Phycisphaerales bacterium]|nr:carboxylating nicotinate-nucleotide diphosphorylase [Phycisphaerales bacterium]
MDPAKLVTPHHSPDGQPVAPAAPGVDLNTLRLPELYAALAKTGLVRRLLEIARDEDLGSEESPWHGRARLSPGQSWGGDITTASCVDPARVGHAQLVMRVGGVVAGLEVMGDLLDVFAPGCTFEPSAVDGTRVSPGAVLGVLKGPLDEILELERTLLNLLSRLCGVATNTAVFHSAMLGGEGNASKVRAKLYDTRKTTPGLRVLEKYAVRCGGGHCHRMGLYDALLIKDNHIAGMGVVKAPELPGLVLKAVEKARELAQSGGHYPPAFVEVEVDDLEQLRALLTLPRGVVDIVLLDNMGVEKLREAAALRDRMMPGLQLEASGGVSLTTIHSIAQTGVERISVGALTHGAVGVDIGLDIE